MRNVFKMIPPVIRRGLLCLLLPYWATFIGYSVVKLIEGGPNEVMAWYKHLGTWVVAGKGPLGDGPTFFIHKFDWRQFLAIQIFCLAVTLVLCFFEWPLSRSRA